MAQKRMFDKDIVESDWFTNMPPTAQLLYFHLGMNADDDGFVANSGIALAISHAAADDLTLLCAKRYVIKIEDGLYLIKHWRKNNFLRNDRKKDSPYSDRLEKFDVKPDGSYTEKTLGIPNDNQMTPNGIPSIDKISLDKSSIDENGKSEGKGKTSAEVMEEIKRKREERNELF